MRQFNQQALIVCSVFQMCRLGRHCPITKVLRDGILRVGSKAAVKLAKEPVDEWFTMLGDNSTTNMLKLYAQVSLRIVSAQAMLGSTI